MLLSNFPQNTGTEQHRHHAVEIALYNMYSILWEIETGAVYRMTKPNDIYSGLGQYDKNIEVVSQEQAEKNAETDQDGENKDLLDTIIEETEEAGVEEESRVEELPEPPAAGETESIVPPPPPTSSVTPIGSTEGADASVATAAQLLAQLELRKKQEAALVRAIQRAETIVESFEGVKVVLILFFIIA